MDKFITDINGKMPIFLDDFRFLDFIYRSGIESLVKGLAPNCIIWGCEVTINANIANISPGAIALNGEILLFDGASISYNPLNIYKYRVKETFSTDGLRTFGDGNVHNVYKLRRCEVYNAGTEQGQEQEYNNQIN